MRLLRWLALPLAAPLLSAQFAAGVARRDITPKEPTPMWGYGSRHDRLSTGTHDPLYAAALVIQAGSPKIAIVGLDLGRSPGEPLPYTNSPAHHRGRNSQPADRGLTHSPRARPRTHARRREGQRAFRSGPSLVSAVGRLRRRSSQRSRLPPDTCGGRYRRHPDWKGSTSIGTPSSTPKPVDRDLDGPPSRFR